MKSYNEVRNIHTENLKKTMTVIFYAMIMVMVFVSCHSYDTKNTEKVRVQDTVFSMGTSFTSTLYGSDSEKLEENLAAIGRVLEETDQNISWRNEESLVNRFNEVHSVSVGAYAEVFETALEVAEQSKGAFDPTVLSVSDLWGIGTSEQRHPEDDEILKALECVDYHQVTLNDGVLSSDCEDIRFELGAIGKGYALKCAYEAVNRDEVSGGILNAGSSIYAFGTKEDGSKFRVGLRDPRGEQDDLIGILELTDCAVSTSGDYEKFFEENGTRYHHILDARTGYPADSGLMQVTVIDKNSTLCDALSTVGFILGLEEGMDLMNKYQVMAIFVDNQRNVYYNNESILDILSFDGEASGYTLLSYKD